MSMDTGIAISAATATATVVLAVTAVRTLRGRRTPRWSEDELRIRRSDLVSDAAQALLAREEWPVVQDVVDACFEAWERDVLANSSLSRMVAKHELDKLLNRQLDVQMGHDYQDALQRANSRSEQPSGDFGALSVDAAHKIARTLAPAMRREFTHEYWRHHEDG